jgi:hypothetical protein
MKFISPKVHGILDYSVAGVLIGAPFLLGFAEASLASAVIAVGGGVGLFVYSLLTDYSAGLRSLIPFRLHLILDAVAATALLAAPFLFGFGGMARGFYLAIGLSVLAVVACTQQEADTVRDRAPLVPASGAAG